MSKLTLIDHVKILKKEFDESIQSIQDSRDIESLRIKYLGRKGQISEFFKILGKIPDEDRKYAGQAVNALKIHIQEALENKKSFEEVEPKKDYLDISLPGDQPPIGRYHPLTSTLRLIKRSFQNMGFEIAQGPEVETEYYNFEALNIPKGHPARDMQDTFFVGEDRVLRTHTSPVQIRVMEKQSPPVRIIAPGRCYRKDTPDASHSPVFQQVEGLCVDEGISFGDLKGVILNFARSLFGSGVKIRFRPSFFPFTEPSAEYDFSCLICKGKGCRVCKDTGWLEISGAGMVNPAVFTYVGYDSEKYTGYAFGMGVERITMLLYGIRDIRVFYENDIRFLSQF
jgi:phenylalanyl-tRNA synthetase alpha chain